MADFPVRGLSANLSGVNNETATSLAGLSVLVVEDEMLRANATRSPGGWVTHRKLHQPHWEGL